mmetsp:Transcript_61978/g.134339  ORF Transcript_61978/g.134339 Transcript_61978/m.134339 type:complete len:213 (+) Transcript_61978:255-893(+)
MRIYARDEVVGWDHSQCRVTEFSLHLLTEEDETSRSQARRHEGDSLKASSSCHELGQASSKRVAGGVEAPARFLLGPLAGIPEKLREVLLVQPVAVHDRGEQRNCVGHRRRQTWPHDAERLDDRGGRPDVDVIQHIQHGACATDCKDRSRVCRIRQFEEGCPVGHCLSVRNLAEAPREDESPSREVVLKSSRQGGLGLVRKSGEERKVPQTQ